MLQLELAGKKFIKAEHNRILRQRLSRTKGSIEYKHRNISAVMEMLGLPSIRGYMPAVNYQARLFEIIEEQLAGNRLLSLSDQPGKFTAPSDGIAFHNPPPRREAPKEVAPVIRRILRRFDPAARDARAHRLGEAGERYLFNAEQAFLHRTGRPCRKGAVGVEGRRGRGRIRYSVLLCPG